MKLGKCIFDLRSRKGDGMFIGFLIVLTCVSLLFVSQSYASSIPEDGPGNYAYTKGDYESVDRIAKSVFYIEMYQSDYTQIGSGSGFLMFDEGLLITNQHVIDGAAFLLIQDDDGTEYIVNQVVVSDKERDIAILYFPESINYRSLDFESSFSLKRMQPVIAIGSPLGLSGTISDGIISAFPTDSYGVTYIQFTAPISAGSSGGCLLNDDLKVIGITFGGYDEGQNIGFALPIYLAKELYQQWNKREVYELGTSVSWDTVGYGIHKPPEIITPVSTPIIEVSPIIISYPTPNPYGKQKLNTYFFSDHAINPPKRINTAFYTGPGDNYLRAKDGKANFISKSFKYGGMDGDWVFTRLKTDLGMRYGYIRIGQGQQYAQEIPQMEFSWIPTKITENRVPLWDSLMEERMGPVCYLQKGTNVSYLCNFYIDGMTVAYIEAEAMYKKVRGFVYPSQLDYQQNQ